MIERRRPVMQAWSDYVTGASESATVIPFVGQAAAIRIAITAWRVQPRRPQSVVSTDKAIAELVSRVNFRDGRSLSRALQGSSLYEP
jgi:hypothetical protein